MASSNGFGRGPAAFIPSARLNNQGRATPESDAFASSDEDVDLTHSVHSVPSTKPAPPVNQTARRKSFLSEVQSGGVRKLSLPGLAAVGNGSQPGTPSGEHNLWGSPIPLGRVSSNGSTSMWANAGVWNEPRQGTTGRTGGPAGPSTVAFSPFASTSGNAGEETSPINAREITESTAVPFTIPLHPTAKTQRSHSYSVGQITSEKDALAVPGLLPTQPQTRTRQTGVANLRHQPTRPSTLREESEPVEPELFRDRDDDEENFGGVRLNSPALQFTQTVTDALLRQAVAANQNSTTRGVTASSTHNTTNTGNDKMQILNFTHVGTDTAVDDEVTEQTDSGRIERRFSEFAEPPRAHLQTSNLTVKSQWQTALGFGPLEDIPQSRRHSFAEMPTRRGSFAASTGGNTQAYGSVAAAYANVTESPETAKSNKQNPTRHTPFEMQASMEQSDLHNRAYAANYFSGVAPAARSRYEAGVPQSASSYSTTGPFHPGTSAGGFSRPGQDSPLYMVSFKCARADAYYVQDGTGLDVKVGDLVVVEADRGHDLGTVTHAKVNWARARELKEQAADEHYRWLMMFSQYNKTITSTTVNPNGMLAASNHPGAERAPIQGMGLGMHDASHIQEMKPKMIKRLAQPHEIATLRDKEGNEAKAKRVCQQKAAEHKLTMEILDAEFQM